MYNIITPFCTWPPHTADKFYVNPSIDICIKPHYLSVQAQVEGLFLYCITQNIDRTLTWIWWVVVNSPAFFLSTFFTIQYLTNWSICLSVSTM